MRRAGLGNALSILGALVGGGVMLSPPPAFSASVVYANAKAAEVTSGESFQITLATQAASISQVNLDEELASLVVLQNGYAASARLTSTISEMLDILLEIV